MVLRGGIQLVRIVRGRDVEREEKRKKKKDKMFYTRSQNLRISPFDNPMRELTINKENMYRIGSALP